MTFNPDLLLKEDLSFELAIRGLDYDKLDVSTMRQTLRQAFMNNIETKVENLSGSSYFKFSEELSRCYRRYEEFSGIVEGIEVESSCSTLRRYKARMEHLIRRLGFVVELGGSNVEPRLSKILDNMQSQAPELLKAIGQRLEELENFKVSSKNTGALVSAPDHLDEPEENVSGQSTRTTQGSGIKTVVTPSENVEPDRTTEINQGELIKQLNFQIPQFDASRVTMPVLQQQAVHATNEHSSNLVQTTSNFSLYSKLPHPMERFLKEIPDTDGLYLPKLVDFLKRVLKMKQQPGASDAEILHLIFPFTRGPLGERTRLALAENWTFDQYHADLLEFFIPSRQFQTMKQELFHRLQRNGEPLPCYIADIRGSAELLRLPVTDIDIVNVILEGLNPVERSRFVFSSRPTNLQELDKLCIFSQNLGFADKQRIPLPNNFHSARFLAQRSSVNAVKNITPDKKESTTERRPCSYGSQRAQPRCYNCNQLGHVWRHCNQPQGSRKN